MFDRNRMFSIVLSVLGFACAQSEPPASIGASVARLSVRNTEVVGRATNGICSVLTPHVMIDDLAYDHAMVRAEGAGQNTEAAVTRSNIHAVDGTYQGESNVLVGHITVGSEDDALPLDKNGLDPSYNA